MDAQAVLEVLGVLIVAFVLGVLVPLALVFTFVKHRGGSEEMYQLARELKAGKVTGLLPWNDDSLTELAREWVGSATYTESMFGRNDQAGGHVPSTHTDPGWLLAFAMESSKNGAEGWLLAMTSAHRLELHVTSGTCRVTLNGKPMGSLKLGEPTLFAPDGTQLGTWRAGQLTLRGRDVATIDTRTAGGPKRPPALTPLVTNVMKDRTPEDEAWTLAGALLQLGWVRPQAS